MCIFVVDISINVECCPFQFQKEEKRTIVSFFKDMRVVAMALDKCRVALAAAHVSQFNLAVDRPEVERGADL
jgi:hypothetical protein